MQYHCQQIGYPAGRVTVFTSLATTRVRVLGAGSGCRDRKAYCGWMAINNQLQQSTSIRQLTCKTQYMTVRLSGLHSIDTSACTVGHTVCPCIPCIPCTQNRIHDAEELG